MLITHTRGLITLLITPLNLQVELRLRGLVQSLGFRVWGFRVWAEG